MSSNRKIACAEYKLKLYRVEKYLDKTVLASSEEEAIEVASNYNAEIEATVVLTGSLYLGLMEYLQEVYNRKLMDPTDMVTFIDTYLKGLGVPETFDMANQLLDHFMIEFNGVEE